ncbi:hypothetical protein O0L34_g3757 [Tuta absoluta]|nr:hypothetical protein O0L34_g3757 [Tuta absoluta]
MLIRKMFKCKLKGKKQAAPVLTSTPNASGGVPVEVAPSPDVSIIERTCSSPLLISSESFDDVEIDYLYRRVRLGAIHPSNDTVQQPAHSVLPDAGNDQQREENPLAENNSPHIAHPATPTQYVNCFSRIQFKPNIRQTNANKTHQTDYTKSCGNVSRKIDKTCSPFRKNCSLQTFLDDARKTSPLQISIDSTYKTSPQWKSKILNSQTFRILRSIPSLSCPSSPRDSKSAHPRSRSRSPFSGSRESTAEARRRINTLKNITEKTSTPITDRESNRSTLSAAESASPTSAPSKQLCVQFTPGPAGVARGDVQELYFNVEMKCRCKPCTRRFESTGSSQQKDTNSPNMRLCQALGSTEVLPSPATSTCVPGSGAAIKVVTMRCSVCGGQQSTPAQMASSPQKTSSPRQTMAVVCTAQSNQAQTEPRKDVQLQSPCKTDAGTNLSGAESLCSVTGSWNSAGVACNARRARYLQTKLHATQLCLKNKEETVKVQAESLTCAEQRIALLTLRATQQRRELESCQQELCKLKGVTMKTQDSCCQARSSKSDACCSTFTNPCCNTEANTEVENQKNMVVTLQNNLSIIEELYRECFYETVKQEELIEKLRKSCLDVRLMEKDKADRIGRLENVVNTQKWSLKTCQDVAAEVENLKLEILNFLNNSNNDSGMWEQSVAGDVGEDINDIMLQLHQLREVLQEESIDTSTLKQENNSLKELNQELECKISEQHEQMNQLECTIQLKDDSINSLRRENEKLGCEIRGLRSELEAAKKRIGELQNENGCVKTQLTQATEEAGEVKTEVCRLRARNEELQRKNKVISEELEKADDIIKENCKVRSEVSYLTQQVALWRQQLGASEQRVHSVEAELARARMHCRSVDQCYREKVDAVAALEVQLERAHSRGAQLCAESRRAVTTVRNWIQRMQHTNAEQSLKIKAQQSLISMLQKTLQGRMADVHEDSRPQPPPTSGFPRPSQTNIFPRQSQETTQEFTVSEDQQDLTQDLVDYQQSCDYFTSYSTPPFDGVGCSKCAAKRPADPSRSLTDDSDEVVPVGRNKRQTWSKDVKSEITIGVRLGHPKCVSIRTNRAKKDTNEETDTGSGTSQNTSAGRDDGATQACTSRVRVSSAQTCSHIPALPRQLLCNRVCNDRVAHYKYMQRNTASSAREACVQRPARCDGYTSPSRIPVPRAVSPSGELLDRVSRLSEALEESQQRWSRSKLPHQQPQREHHR